MSRVIVQPSGELTLPRPDDNQILYITTTIVNFVKRNSLSFLSLHGMDRETTPLMESSSSSVGRIQDYTSENRSHDGGQSSSLNSSVKLKKHITLPYAVAIIVGNVIGSGIFISPKGVTQNIGSVGASLIVWAVTGLYNLAQALCYAELGALIPKAGGDYAYLYYIVGPLPAFMTAWVHILMIASSSCALIAQTAAIYMMEPLNLLCYSQLITFLAVFVIISLATANATSAILGVRVQTIFTIAKMGALISIIIIGIVKMSTGNLKNFSDPFKNTKAAPGNIALSVLDGYFAYKGWELINALPEEMVNPQRDLPLAVYISMSIVTVVYVLTNMAYFSILSPAELLESDAVALTFSQKTLGNAYWVMSIAVALSCMGAVNGDFLSNSRYLFAGGRFKQMPQVFSMINVRRMTPIPAIMALCIIAMLYCVIQDLQALEQYASLTVQMKMLMTLVALFWLRYKKPNIHRPIKVNTVIAVITLLLMIALVVLSFYKSPFNTGMGCLVFLVGVPIYYFGQFLASTRQANSCMDVITRFLQKSLLISKESQSSSDNFDAIIQEERDSNDFTKEE